MCARPLLECGGRFTPLVVRQRREMIGHSFEERGIAFRPAGHAVDEDRASPGFQETCQLLCDLPSQASDVWQDQQFILSLGGQNGPMVHVRRSQDVLEEVVVVNPEFQEQVCHSKEGLLHRLEGGRSRDSPGQVFRTTRPLTERCGDRVQYGDLPGGP